MPLNDSFNKRSQVKVAKLSAVPTADDITFTLTNAQNTPRKSVYLAWQVNDDKRMLAVTCGMNPYTEDARWVLRNGHELDSPIIWTHESADALMIHTLVSDSVNQSGPAAAIPDFLKPGAVQPGENSGAPGSGTGPVAGSASVDGGLGAGTGAGISGVADKDYSSEAVGSIFAQRYEIIDEIGKGATSTVYRAKQIQIGRIVALKLMHPHLLKEEINKKRFEQEAKATAALSHPNLVLVHDYGTSPLGRPFIVMDYVDGPSLDTIFGNQNRLTSQQFIDVFTQCCRGLAHAHKRGVIHRDIKPSNIRLYKDEHNVVTAKILDFGIAKLFTQDEEALKMTETGAVMGSPAFMSPEQSRAEHVDHRTDIYSLGIVMYQAVTGVLPFKGKDIFETLYKHIYEAPPTFDSLNLGFKIPDAVEALIHRALQKDPANRYQQMEDLQRDLARLSNTSSTSASQVATSPFLSQLPSSSSSISLTGGSGLLHDTIQEPNNPVVPTTPAPASPTTPAPASPTTPAPASPTAPTPASPAAPTSALPTAPTSASPSAPTPATPAAPTPGSPTTSPPSTTELDLLKAAKVITEEDIAKARDITSRLGGQISAMLVADGKVDRTLLEVAKRCSALINSAILDLGHAVILLNYSQRSRLDFDKAVEELGWNLG